MALSDAAEDVDNALTRDGFRGLSFENAFGGALSFMRRTYTKDLTDVDLAITGVPFDQAVEKPQPCSPVIRHMAGTSIH